MNYSEESRLCGELISLRLTIMDLKGAKAPVDVVRDHEMRALQIAIQLKAECERRVQ